MVKDNLEILRPFSLDHLNPTEFEEFCYDLLHSLGYTNVSWRKGTGLDTSPSDRGRDIECDYERKDIDNYRRFEKWFVECKHYKKGVPSDEIANALSWATAETPSVLLIIASNFLSNACKDYIDDYRRNNNPRFVIRVWEKPDLERLTLSKSALLRKYRISGDFTFLSILHPAHILYIKGVQLNTLDYLFEICDKLDLVQIEHIFYWTYGAIIRPRYRKPVTGNETIKELQIDETSYKVLKDSCYQIVRSGVLDDMLLVHLLVTFILQCQLMISDYTSVDKFIGNLKDDSLYFRNRMAEKPEKKDILEDMIKFTEQRIETAEQNVRENYDLYTYFCENVVKQLLLEKYIKPRDYTLPGFTSSVDF